MEWLNKPIIWVTGKGGVGKTAVAAGIADHLSRQGRKVLLVELGSLSYISQALSLGLKDSVPYSLEPYFDFKAAVWSGPTCLREYVLHYIKVDSLYRLFFENKIMKSLLNVAPAVNELAVTGKITSGIRNIGPKLDFETLVIDGFASGHMMALLKAPSGMAEAVQQGPMGRESRRIHEVLANPNLCSYVITGIAEELPVIESIELKSQIAAIFPQISPVSLLNRWINLSFEGPQNSPVRSELKEFKEYVDHIEERQTDALAKLKHEFAGQVYLCPLVYSLKFDQVAKEIGEALRKI